MITLEMIHQLLDYNPDTGVFTWRSSYKRRICGHVAGTVHTTGTGGKYIRISVRGKKLYAHRVAFWITNGVYPEQEVDHVNRNGCDNRLCNLRLVSSRENAANRKQRRDTSRYGVGVYKDGSRFVAMVKRQGVLHRVGSFGTPEQAADARTQFIQFRET